MQKSYRIHSFTRLTKKSNHVFLCRWMVNAISKIKRELMLGWCVHLFVVHCEQVALECGAEDVDEGPTLLPPGG